MRGRALLYPIAVLAITASGFAGCETGGDGTDSGFTYKPISVAEGTVAAGEGSSVAFRGGALELTGPGIQTGDTLRSVKVARSDLSLLDIAGTKGKVRIISVVPSIDTKVCEQQTHHLSEKNQGLDATVALYTISVDTPFAQGRFAKEAKIQNVTFLSDYRGGDFGRAHGLLLEGPHLLARAVMVVDQHNVVRYLQVTPELANMPDMEAAFEAARSLVDKPAHSE